MSWVKRQKNSRSRPRGTKKLYPKKKGSGFPKDIAKAPKNMSKIHKTHILVRAHQIGLIFEAASQYAKDKNYPKGFAYYTINAYISLLEKTYKPGKRTIGLDYFKNIIKNDVGNTAYYKFKKLGVDITEEIITFLIRLRFIDLRYGKKGGVLIVNSERFYFYNTHGIRDPYWRTLIEKFILPADWSLKRVYLSRSFIDFVKIFKPTKRAQLTMLAVLILERAPKYKPVTQLIHANALHTTQAVISNLNKILENNNYIINHNAYLYLKNKVNGDIRFSSGISIPGSFLHIGHRSYPLNSLGFCSKLPKGEYNLLSCSCLTNGQKIKNGKYYSILNAAREVVKARRERASKGQPSGIRRDLTPIYRDDHRLRAYNYSDLTKDQIYSIPAPPTRSSLENPASLQHSNEKDIYTENLLLSSNKPNYSNRPAPLFDDSKISFKEKAHGMRSLLQSINEIFKLASVPTPHPLVKDIHFVYRSGIKTTKFIKRALHILQISEYVMSNKIHTQKKARRLSSPSYGYDENILKHMKKCLFMTKNINKTLYSYFDNKVITRETFLTPSMYEIEYLKFHNKKSEKRVKDEMLLLANLVLDLYKKTDINYSHNVRSQNLSDKKKYLLRQINRTNTISTKPHKPELTAGSPSATTPSLIRPNDRSTNKAISPSNVSSNTNNSTILKTSIGGSLQIDTKPTTIRKI